jgi:YesN/AraC family two-component response regulator
MAMELNTIVDHFASTFFKVQGVYRYKIPAGSKGIQKTAPYPGFIFPLSGCAEYQFNDSPYFIKPGVVVHGSADTAIRKRVIGDEDWEFVSVLYETCGESPLMKLKNTHFSLTVGQSPQLYDMLHHLYATSNRPGGLAALQTETLFRRALVETFLCVRNQTKYGAQELFESVSEYIHTHYMDGLTVSSLARQNGVNENRLFYVFQKYAGMGPADYLRTYRMNRARELLVTTSIPIGTIGEQAGYPDALYFSRIFKRHFGVPPSKFREE